jgi:hypothetical protein
MDLKFQYDSTTLGAEVMRLKVGSSIQTVKSVIEKANRQIKRLTPNRSGIVYLLIGLPATVRNTEGRAWRVKGSQIQILPARRASNLLRTGLVNTERAVLTFAGGSDRSCWRRSPATGWTLVW